MSTRVITAPTVEPITLAEAKMHLKEDLVDASNDARISACLSAARQAVEHDMGRSIMLPQDSAGRIRGRDRAARPAGD